MTSEEMASDEVKKQRQAFIKEGIDAAQLAQAQASLLFFCFPWGSPEPQSFGPNLAFLREALAIL